MAALMVFGVFLVSIALSIPIATSMIVGSISPILLLGKGGSIVQLLNNTFSGANSTPILAVRRQNPRRCALCGNPDLSVLRCNFRFRSCNDRSCRFHGNSFHDQHGL